jgi:outer membrane protein assembly factor BamB
MLTRSLPLAGLLALAAAAAAADWPQWQGSQRDNVSRETGLLKDWPEGGPTLAWTFEEAGIGYSGPAVVGDRVYTLGADERQDYVLAIDAGTGKRLWATPVGPYVQNDYGSGPRCTPTVDGDRLYVLSSAGRLVCLKTSGEKVWTVDLVKELGGSRPRWNYSESPLVDGDKVICTPGGSQGTLAALDKATGKVLWRSKGLREGAAYSSVVVAEVGGVRQYVQLTTGGVAGVAARDGQKLWIEPLAVNRVAIISTPIVHDNFVYVTSDYNAGCGQVKLTAGGGGVTAEVVYQNRVIENHHEGVVLVDGLLYGCSGNTNGRAGKWVCQDFASGERVWESTTFAQAGSITYADGRLYAYGQNDGTAVLVEVSKEGWKEHGRFTIPRHTQRREYRNNVWTHPVVANGKLYLRDQELLFCYDVRDKK